MQTWKVGCKDDAICRNKLSKEHECVTLVFKPQLKQCVLNGAPKT